MVALSIIVCENTFMDADTKRKGTELWSALMQGQALIADAVSETDAGAVIVAAVVIVITR